MQPLLLSSILLFPMWMQLWEAHPLSSEDVQQPVIYTLAESQAQLQSSELRNGDLATRRSIYAKLASVPLPETQTFLVEQCLPMEKNPLLKASILRYLQSMPLDGIPPQKIAILMDDKSNDVAVEAMRLYVLLPNASMAALEKCLDSPNPTIQAAAWRTAADSPKLASTLKEKPLALKDNPDERLRLLAFQTALRQSSPSKNAQAWFNEALAATDNEKLLLAQFCDTLPAKSKDALYKDPNPVIRQALCSSLGILKNESLLLRALKDKSSSVCLAALANLANCNAISDSVLPAVFDVFNHESRPVRNQAEATYLALARQMPEQAISLLETGISSMATPSARLHSAHCARKLHALRLADTMLAQLTDGDAPEVTAAYLETLAELGVKSTYTEKIIAFSSHKSPLVRQMAVRIMGNSKLPGVEKVIIDRAERDRAPSVRSEAFIAMGRHPSPAYITPMIACLKRTKASQGMEGTMAEERANAAWSLGHVAIKQTTLPRLREIAARLKVQCTTAVIPDIEPMFDDIIVLANSFLSLAILAKETDDTQVNECFQAVIDMYDIPSEELKMMDNAKVPRSPVTSSVMRQAVLLRQGKTVESQPVPKEPLSFLCKPL